MIDPLNQKNPLHPAETSVSVARGSEAVSVARRGERQSTREVEA
jgi:hypothetical protein